MNQVENELEDIFLSHFVRRTLSFSKIGVLRYFQDESTRYHNTINLKWLWKRKEEIEKIAASYLFTGMLGLFRFRSYSRARNALVVEWGSERFKTSLKINTRLSRKQVTTKKWTIHGNYFKKKGRRLPIFFSSLVH